MKISIVITVLNEEESIGDLLYSLVYQTKQPDQIVIVDGGSRDSTVKIIKEFQEKHKIIRLVIKKCSRAQGRNIGVRMAKYPIIAMTDADCVADKNWLKRITKPFERGNTDIVAGFYQMSAKTDYQKALARFIGVTPDNFRNDFLPSTRSIAFNRGFWKKIGGFPESKENSAEDTNFNYLAVRAGANIVRVKNAIVYWRLPSTLGPALKKFYNYARWDVSYGIWWHPVQRFGSHNIKVLLVHIRYLTGIIFFLLGFGNYLLWFLLIIFLILYIFWAFYKVFKQFNDFKIGVWGIIIQFLADFSVMAGFFSGIIS